MNIQLKTRLRICEPLLAGLVMMGLLFGSNAEAIDPKTPVALSCPDEQKLDLRPNPDAHPGQVRAVAPSAGSKSSLELFSHARFAGLAYELYRAFVAGKDPRAAFNSPDLKLVSLIYGEPGPQTERGPKPKNNITLYGFVADEIATGHRYVVFRGTQEAAEWVRNAQMGQRPYPAGTRRLEATAHVHAGFFKIFESLTLETGQNAKPFSSALPGLIASKDVIFVGHSLGSALATFAGVEAARLAPERASKLRVVTLASPRVGDAGFGVFASHVGQIDRVCNMVDIVTAVPPSTRALTYKHVGTLFPVSSFDWPYLVNDLQKAGDQINCWHSDQSYDAMLNPDYKPSNAALCYRAQK